MNDALVSVVMCTYNGALYVEEQLVSILKQTYPALEVIIGDDASTDGTFELLTRLAEKDPRVKLYRNEKNLGYNTNFSIACSKASGAYIAISDQDDIWEERKVEALVTLLEKSPGTMMVHGISARFEEMGKPHLRSLKMVNYYSGSDVRPFYLLNIISGHSMLFRSSLLKKALPFPPDVYYDWWLVANAVAEGRIEALEEILVWHRMHGANATGAAKPKIPFYRQMQVIMPALLGIQGMDPAQKAFGEKLLNFYKEFPEKRFSFPLFLFLLRHARILLAHKKRTFPWISYTKHAYKYASRDTNA
ncbi:MAG TPA: glycosyltransferase [Flavisolibacter sp.]|nr:glycosyltransferase [Flavisolibacter sp.]